MLVLVGVGWEAGLNESKTSSAKLELDHGWVWQKKLFEGTLFARAKLTNSSRRGCLYIWFCPPSFIATLGPSSAS